MVTIFSLFGIVIMIAFILYNINYKGQYISIANIISVLSIVDVFIPAIIGHLSGRYFSLPYSAPIVDSEALIAVIIADVSLILLIFGYRTAHDKKERPCVKYINEKYLSFFFYFSVIVYFLNMYFEIKSSGSLMAYYEFRIRRVYLVNVESVSPLASLMSLLSEIMNPIRLIVISILLGNKEHSSRSKVRTYLFITALMALLSLSRGTIIIFFIAIIATYEYNSGVGEMSLELKSKMKKYAIIGIAAFSLYGGLRNTLSNQFWEEEDNGFIENVVTSINNSCGASLIGIVRSIRYVEDHTLFYGSSYSDMFLSFIPRSIMPNKPKQYGIVTLTIAQGSPDTTMDAISMEGEALMNFGYLGIIIMFFWGRVFHFVDSFRLMPRLKYFLAASVFPIASTCSWMSFTGFFAQTKYLLIYMLILNAIIKIKK